MSTSQDGDSFEDFVCDPSNSVYANSRLIDIGTAVEQFCKQRLNREYRDVCRRMFVELSDHDSPLQQGRPASNAAGLLHAVGVVNFLFDKNGGELSLQPAEIAKHFAVAAKTMNSKSKQIRDWLELEPFDPNFITESLNRHPEVVKMREQLQQIAALDSVPIETQQSVQVHVELLDAPLPIWRRFVMQDGALSDLHWMIQLSMGWQGYHMHQFELGRKFFVDPDLGLDSEISDSRLEFTTDYLTSDFLVSKKKQPLIYEYDFGDNWRHLVSVEKILPLDDKLKYPVCLEGENACPPEDCGGPHGYANLLDILADKTHPDHEDMMEWTDGPIDPHQFNAAAQTSEMHRLIDELFE